MQRLGCLFTDKISGERVNLYRDRLGRHWMATNRWALFRVARSTPTAQEIGDE